MSTELKKGDLVMTEHGLAWYDSEAPLHKKTYRYVLVGLLGNVTTVDTVSPATREHVEAYLNEKGFVPKGKGSYKYCSENNNYFIHSYNDTQWDVDLEKALNSGDFDTAQEQLAESILVARLLNAVK